MKRLLWGILTLFFILSSLNIQAAEYKKEYKLSVVPGATSGWGMSAQYFADLVKAKTQDRINIKVYCNSQLMAGMQTSEFLLLRNGSIDFSLSSTINWSPQVKQLNLPCMPFFISHTKDRYKSMDAIEAGQAGKMLIAAIEKKGVQFLGWGENGFRELTTSKKVAEPKDLVGMKIRVVGSPIFIDTFRALGANPATINWSEAIVGFQQGTVDGQENPTNGINIPSKMWLYHKFHCDWHYVIDPLMLCSNVNVWKNFTPEDQKILLECAKEMEVYSKALSRLGQDPSYLAYLQKINKVPAVTDPYKTLKDNGMTVVVPTEKQMQEFYDTTASVRKKWTENIGEDLVKAAEADMQNANKN
ncbi:MAG: TRAP transporter substrate-binding protein DctP [Desulfovibrionaceae bacterium]|nr:TRAP transporter substrate-binding protein DctP [Desulfovibrionaceae bacterium]